MTIPSTDPNFGMEDPPPSISAWGHHEGVLVSGRVFDNNVPFGVSRAVWEDGYEVYVNGVGEMTIRTSRRSRSWNY
jgi:hypothetical protein